MRGNGVQLWRAGPTIIVTSALLEKSPQIYAEGKNGSSIPQESWKRYLVAKNIEDEVLFHLLGESNHHLPPLGVLQSGSVS